jgi:hypothetical protein
MKAARGSGDRRWSVLRAATLQLEATAPFLNTVRGDEVLNRVTALLRVEVQTLQRSLWPLLNSREG